MSALLGEETFELSLASSLNTDQTDSTVSMEASHIIVFSFVKMSEKTWRAVVIHLKPFSRYSLHQMEKKISKIKNMVQLLADGW